MGPDDVLQLLDDEPVAAAGAVLNPWTILIVDDDDAVHESTRFALFNYATQNLGGSITIPAFTLSSP